MFFFLFLVVFLSDRIQTVLIWADLKEGSQNSDNEQREGDLEGRRSGDVLKVLNTSEVEVVVGFETALTGIAGNLELDGLAVLGPEEVVLSNDGGVAVVSRGNGSNIGDGHVVDSGVAPLSKISESSILVNFDDRSSVVRAEGDGDRVSSNIVVKDIGIVSLVNLFRVESAVIGVDLAGVGEDDSVVLGDTGVASIVEDAESKGMAILGPDGFVASNDVVGALVIQRVGGIITDSKLDVIFNEPLDISGIVLAGLGDGVSVSTDNKVNIVTSEGTS
jgi:hypothetical protein